MLTYSFVLFYKKEANKKIKKINMLETIVSIEQLTYKNKSNLP
jgi:hypothetical protein